MRIVIAPLIIIALGACQKQDDVVIANAINYCKDWKHLQVSRDDRLTERTASQIEANNNSRMAWHCAYGRNEAYTTQTPPRFASVTARS